MFIDVPTDQLRRLFKQLNERERLKHGLLTREEIEEIIKEKVEMFDYLKRKTDDMFDRDFKQWPQQNEQKEEKPLPRFPRADEVIRR